MSRRVTHDGQHSLEVRFPFHRGLVDRIKTLPRRRWNAGDRCWLVADQDVVALVDLLREEGFGFDTATRELYAANGGSGTLTPAAADRPPAALPGLFDGDTSASPDATPTVGDDDYTVSRLNERVRDRIESAFPAPVWLVGEISGFNKSAHRRHVGFELVERSSEGKANSRVQATLFESTRRSVEAALHSAGDPFALEDEVTVRLRVRVELYVPWGQYRTVVEDLDVQYTLGEAARRREEIVRRLTTDGLVELNRALPWPPMPLRVALVTSLGSDAFNDVRRTLQESGYAFRLTAHGARVQGRATESSVLNALDWFASRPDEFDVLLVCRGGGSRTDLAWFDSEPLGRAVARFPLPVVVGIGHEQDRSVLDSVARSCKTPTAAAALLVGEVRESLERMETSAREILVRVGRRIEREGRTTVERERRLVLAATGLLDRHRETVRRQRRRAVVVARARVASARERLSRWVAAIPGAATLRLRERRRFVDVAVAAVVRGAGRSLADSRGRLREAAGTLGPRAERRIARDRERVEARSRRLRLVDPERVLDRGYAILRRVDGGLLADASEAPPGLRVRAKLRRGTLALRSEGPEPSGENP